MSNVGEHRGGLPGWGKGLIWAGLILVIGLAVVIFLGHASTARWQRYAATLRAAGAPLTFEEIEARRATVKEAENGARVIERLFTELKRLPTGRREYNHVLRLGARGDKADFFVGIPKYAIEPSRRFLDGRRGVLDKLYAIEQMPKGRARIEYAENPIHTLLSHLTATRNACKLVWLDATLELIDGDPQAASRRVSIILNISRALHDEPFVISRLVMMAVDRLAVKAIEDTLRTGELDEVGLARLSDQLDTHLAASTMRWALLGERACFVGVCDQVAAGKITLAALTQGGGGGGVGGVIPPVGGNLLPEFIVRKNQLEGALMLARLVEAVDDPDALIAAARRLDIEIPAAPKSMVLVRTLLPSLSRAMELHARTIAQLTCARLAVAAERFRRDTGRLPNSIEELAPRWIDTPPTDPFDGNALRFVIIEEGIIIYSIGEDLVDDGGGVATVEGARSPPDVGFRLFRPELRGVLLTDEPPPSDD